MLSLRRWLGLSLFVVFSAWILLAQTSSAPAGRTQLGADCNCSGYGISGPCSCNCQGPGCTCICSTGDGCNCKSAAPALITLPAGTSVQSAADRLSNITIQTPRVIVLQGADQIIPTEIRTTFWQAVALLTQLPGVKLGIPAPNPDLFTRMAANPSLFVRMGNSVVLVRHPVSPGAIHVCIHRAATLAEVLDTLSEDTGRAFAVSGTPVPQFPLQIQGTLPEVLEKLSAATGARITLAE